MTLDSDRLSIQGPVLCDVLQGKIKFLPLFMICGQLLYGVLTFHTLHQAGLDWSFGHCTLGPSQVDCFLSNVGVFSEH